MRLPRVLLLVLAGSIGLGCVAPGAAWAGTLLATAADRIAVPARDGLPVAGYTARRAHYWINGTVTVPDLGDCAGGDEGAFAGIELASRSGDGAQYGTGGVLAACLDGAPSYTAVFGTRATGQVPIDEVVQAGDQLEVFCVRRLDKIHISVANLTRDWLVEDAFDGLRPWRASAVYSAVLVDGSVLPVLDPEVIDVTDVLVDGRPLKSADPNRHVLVDEAGDPLVRATRITDGTDFQFLGVG